MGLRDYVIRIGIKKGARYAAGALAGALVGILASDNSTAFIAWLYSKGIEIKINLDETKLVEGIAALLIAGGAGAYEFVRNRRKVVEALKEGKRANGSSAAPA